MSASFPDEEFYLESLRRCAEVLGIGFLPVLPAPSPEALSFLPRAVAFQFEVAPVTTVLEESPHGPKLCVAISDPLSVDLRDRLRSSLHREIRFVLAPRSEVRRIIIDCYPKRELIDRLDVSLVLGALDANPPA